MYFIDLAMRQEGASVDINPAPGGFMLQPLVILLSFVSTGHGLGIFRKEREAPIGLGPYKFIFALMFMLFNSVFGMFLGLQEDQSYNTGFKGVDCNVQNNKS